jgi:hypothetical protein
MEASKLPKSPVAAFPSKKLTRELCKADATPIFIFAAKSLT